MPSNLLPQTFVDWVFEIIKLGLVGGATFWASGGFKRKKAETENVIITAIREGAEWIADNNENLRAQIDRIGADHKKEIAKIKEDNKEAIRTIEERYQQIINALEVKFGFKEREHTAIVENLQAEKKIIEKVYATKCLEYDMLFLEHEKLKSENGAIIRRLKEN